MTQMMTFATLAMAGLALAGCADDRTSLGTTRDSAPSLMLVTDLRTAAGEMLGTATVSQEADGARIIAQVRGLPAGDYAMHLHAVGRCDAPDFVSAGPHFNPAGRQHGRDNPAGAHAGDLPNLTVDANGRGSLSVVQAGLRLADGDLALLDADGAAVVLHAKADDYRTDPAGNAGARIACGVLTRGR